MLRGKQAVLTAFLSLEIIRNNPCSSQIPSLNSAPVVCPRRLASPEPSARSSVTSAPLLPGVLWAPDERWGQGQAESQGSDFGVIPQHGARTGGR